MIEFSATIEATAVMIRNARKLGGEAQQNTDSYFAKWLTEEQMEKVEAHIKKMDDGEDMGLVPEDIT